MRGKQAFKNIIANILLQFILAVCGLILPRWYLITYGSEMNGVVSSLTQFMAYLTLVEAGIGAAAVISLYGPLADQNENEINRVLAAAQKFYRQSGILYLLLVTALVIGYPYIVHSVVSAGTIRMVAVILSISNLIDYFFLGKYRALLTADQRGYVIIHVQVFGTILNTLIAIFLMSLNVGIVEVKFFSTLVYIMRSFIIFIYIRRHYPFLNLKVMPKQNAFSERWAALVHQIAGIILNNTNLVILTLFLGKSSLLIISVYTIYQMVANLISNVISSFTNSLSSGFGEIIYKKNVDILRKAYSDYEFAFFIVMFLLYTCMGTLFISFIRLYTNGITDVEYIRPSFAALFTGIGILTNLRNPGITLIIAAGHYKKTQHRAMKEAAINIIVALVLVRTYGAEGVLIGTLAAFLYSSISVLYYCNRFLINNTLGLTIRRLLRNIAIMLFLWIAASWFKLNEAENYLQWLLKAALAGSIACGTFLTVNTVSEPEQMKSLFQRIHRIFIHTKYTER